MWSVSGGGSLVCGTLFSMSDDSRDAAAIDVPAQGRNMHVSERLCTRCKHSRSVTEFTLQGRGEKRRSVCRVCEAEQKRLNYYNLDEITYQAILIAQNKSCAICEQPFHTEVPHVDHDHMCCPGKKSCGKCVRGLLCNHCNKAVGLFEDDPDILYSAARYLSREAEYQ